MSKLREVRSQLKQRDDEMRQMQKVLSYLMLERGEALFLPGDFFDHAPAGTVEVNRVANQQIKVSLKRGPAS